MPKYLYVACTVYPWTSLQAPRVDLVFTGDSSRGFLLVFNTLEELQDTLGKETDYFVIKAKR